MPTPPLTLYWAGETLALLPERAIWWGRTQTLFIADPHFGKAAVFRSAGVPVTDLTQDEDLRRLDGLVKRLCVRQLVILGDFFHARGGRSKGTMSALTQWRQDHADLEILLVPGNHDLHAGVPPKEWGVRCVEPLHPLTPFSLSHQPVSIKERFVLAGHWHPSFDLKDSIGSGIRLPCFYFGASLAVLPAYGYFTGTHPIARKPGDRIFLVGPEAVMEVPAKAAGKNSSSR